MTFKMEPWCEGMFQRERRLRYERRRKLLYSLLILSAMLFLLVALSQ